MTAPTDHEKVLIVDFGSQVTQLIARRLREALLAAPSRPWFAPLARALCLAGLAPASRADYAPTLAWDAEARAAGYPEPA